jgi:hypothetical protein
VKVDVILRRVRDLSRVRIEMVFPDDTVHTVAPPPAHFTVLDSGSSKVRLRTSVFVSTNAASTAPFAIQISVAGDAR